MHETSIHVSLKEIRGEAHSNPRNHTENKGTKNKHEKDHEKKRPSMLLLLVVALSSFGFLTP
jgi:hypothetical protein